MLLKILTTIFTQPYQLHFFCYDYSPHLHEQGLFDPEQTVTQHNQALATWLESREAWRDKFIATLKRVFALTWPLAPTNPAEWREQVHAVLTAMAGQLPLDAPEPLDDELLLTGVLWPLRLLKNKNKLLLSVGIEDDDDLEQWLSLCKTWPSDPFMKAEELRLQHPHPSPLPKGEGVKLPTASLSLGGEGVKLPSLWGGLRGGVLDSWLQQGRATFIDTLAMQLSQGRVNEQHDLAALVAHVKPQIEAAWQAGQLDVTQLTWPEMPVVVTAAETSATPPQPPKSFLGREKEQARFREVVRKVRDKPDDQPPILVLYGEGGMGKSRLTERFKDIMQQEFSAIPCMRLDWQTLIDHPFSPQSDPYQQGLFVLVELAKNCRKRLKLSLSRYETLCEQLEAIKTKVQQAWGRLDNESQWAAVREIQVEQLHNAVADITVMRFLSAHLSKKEYDLFINPLNFYAEAIGEALFELKQPAVLILDTYELVEQANGWVKRVQHEAGGHLIWVLSGRNDITQVSPADRTQLRYSEMTHLLYPMPLPDFTVEEVQRYFDQRQYPLTVAKAAQVQAVVHGIPFLVDIVADLVKEGVSLAELVGDLSTTEGVSLQRGRGRQHPKLVEKMFERLLKHVGENNEADEKAWFFLALQPRPMREVQAAILGQPLAKAIGQLAARYSSVREVEGLARLHDRAQETVYAYALARHQSLDQVQQVAAAAWQACHAARAKLAQTLPTLEARVDDKEWRQLTLDLVYWLFWFDEQTVWQELAPRLVEAWGFRGWISRWSGFGSDLFDVIDKCQALHGSMTKRYLAQLPFDDDKRDTFFNTLELWQQWLIDEDAEATQQRQAMLLLLRGKWLTEQKRYEAAWDKFLAAEKLLPATAERLKKRLSEVCYNLGNDLLWPDGASNSQPSSFGCKIAQKAVELNPQNGSAWYIYGVALDDLEQPEKAMVAYQKAIAIEPRATRYNGLGNVYRDMEIYDEAIKAYQAAIAIDQKLAYPHNGLGNVYRDIKMYDEAIKAYQAAIAIDQKLAYPHNGLGNVYRDMKAYDEAIKAYQAAITLEPKNHWRYNSLANVYAMTKQWEHALTAWLKAIELEPTNAGWHGCVANCLNQLNRHEEAVPYLARARELMANTSSYNKACIEAVAGEVDAALAYLRQAKAEGHRHMSDGWVKEDPDLESLRGDRRFWEIVGE